MKAATVDIKILSSLAPVDMYDLFHTVVLGRIVHYCLSVRLSFHR